MIIVVVTPTGDRAEADDPESALTAARQLKRDAADLCGCASRFVVASFYVDEKLVGQLKGAF